jgi:hypothetical protein
MKTAPLLLFFFVLSSVHSQDAGADLERIRTIYLITESELQSIESYKANSEREKAIWLSQAKDLRTKAENLAVRSVKLETLSADLSFQLARERERNRKLEMSFNESETEYLTLISSKNGKIAELKQELADQTLETERHKSKSRVRLIAGIVLAGAWAAFFAFKICRFFRLIP